MKVLVKTHQCIGAGACVLAAPKVFDQDDEGIVIVLQPNPSAELADSVRAAVAACPAAVISTDEGQPV